MKLSSKTGELKSALANGAIPYSADVDFFFFEIEVVDFSLGRFSNSCLLLAHFFFGTSIPGKDYTKKVR